MILHGDYLLGILVESRGIGNLIQSDANDLGKEPSSHGCVHLSLADSKWVYKNIVYGTKFVID